MGRLFRDAVCFHTRNRTVQFDHGHVDAIGKGNGPGPIGVRDDFCAIGIPNIHSGTAHDVEVFWFIDGVKAISCVINAVPGGEYNLGIDKSAAAKAFTFTGRAVHQPDNALPILIVGFGAADNGALGLID
jgi:hypothetical protein